jgi:valyl-tRNA synthetase
MTLPEKFTKPYNFKETEELIYQRWQDSGFFNPDQLPPISQNSGTKSVQKEKVKKFSIVLPPPNVTGMLHIGHAAMLAIEDIMVRFHRMSGYRTLWLPGTDHAAIATQAKVEEILYKKEGKTRHDLGREKFLTLVNQYAKESHDTIVSQIKKMGASVDWSREAFTLDEKRNYAVRAAFKKMYEAGLIYRGERIVNWDPKLQTTVSDDEIEWVEETTPLYYLKYGPFTIATARPETKFGDKYVVMHPADHRYEKYRHGEKISLGWINGPVTATIIKDEAIDMTFGTGVMTITPWHDAADFAIAERHKLSREQIIDTQGKLLPIAGEFAGLHIKKARSLVVEKLRAKGLVEKVEEKYTHRIATNSRGGGLIEPQIMRQWFVDVNKKFKVEGDKLNGLKPGEEISLKELMRKVVANGQIKIKPERFTKIYFHWIDNLRDWCISRQIWYGHRVPVWYRSVKNNSKSKPSEKNTGGEKEDKEIYVGLEAPKGDDWQQDPDTLDTWFSSGLWTFSTLGWPEKTKDLEFYHPTDVLETGYDILFFWVARMILLTGFLLNDIPFHTVYLHGLVRDAKGRKMSKSLGNIIDPLEMIEKYGADATRLSLIIGTSPGNDLKLSEEKVRGYKNFANKLWNIARFVLEKTDAPKTKSKTALSAEDKKHLARFESMSREVTDDILNFRYYLAGEKLYHYIWHEFADKIIEAKKPFLKGDDSRPEERASASWLLRHILENTLKLLHPFTPFITEEIWSHLGKNNLLMVEKWPTA